MKKKVFYKEKGNLKLFVVCGDVDDCTVSQNHFMVNLILAFWKRHANITPQTNTPHFHLKLSTWKNLSLSSWMTFFLCFCLTLWQSTGQMKQIDTLLVKEKIIFWWLTEVNRQPQHFGKSFTGKIKLNTLDSTIHSFFLFWLFLGQPVWTWVSWCSKAFVVRQSAFSGLAMPQLHRLCLK